MIDIALIAFATLMGLTSAKIVFDIVRRELYIRKLKSDVRDAGKRRDEKQA